MMSSKKGFTLVEILICILITFIVVGAIGLTLRMGLKLYEKAEANAAVTNGLRFTIDSYNRKVAPFLSQAESVDILENNNDLPANLPTSFDHYLYLEDGALCLWEKGARGPLAGSEYITSVDFKIAKTSDDRFDNFVVSMDLSAQHPTHTAAKADVSVSTYLFNNIILTKGTRENGAVLHYVVKNTVVTAEDLRHLNKSGDILVTSDERTIRIGDNADLAAYASYDLAVQPDTEKHKNVSEILWYITGSQNRSPLSGDLTGKTPTEDIFSDYCWLVVDKNGDPLSGDTVDIGKGKFFVQTSADKAYEFARYGVLRFTVTPIVKNTETDEETIGEIRCSNWIKFLNDDGGKDSLWNLWASVAQMKSSAEDGFFNTADKSKFEVSVTPGGDSVAEIYGYTETANAPSIVLAQLNSRYLKQAKLLTNGDTGNKSYTTITNYSILVDVNINDGDGIGLLLNGRGQYDTSSKIGDTGLMFQVAAKTDTLPMRLYNFGKQHDYPKRRSWGIGDPSGDIRVTAPKEVSKNIAYTSDSDLYKFTGHGKTNKASDSYGPFYGPGYMKNDIFKYVNDYYSDRTKGTINPKYVNDKNNIIASDRLSPYNKERFRILVTVLEYYIDDKDDKTNDKNKPHFIVRMKFVKKLDENDLKLPNSSDPWMSGDKWFKSEPVWYGGFAGAHPEEITSGDETYYRFYAKNHTTGAKGVSFDVKSSDINFQASKDDKLNGNFYITRVPIGESLTNGDHVETLFEAKDLDIIDDLTEAFSLQGNERTLALYKDPSKPRYLGLRVWGNTGEEYKISFYNVELVPGFSANELKAIMPKGAKMYEIGDTGEKTQMNDAGFSSTIISSNENLNSGLFGSNDGSSDGNGNGLYGGSVTSGGKGVMYLQKTK